MEGVESSDRGDGRKGIRYGQRNAVGIDKGQAKEEFIRSETKQNHRNLQSYKNEERRKSVKTSSSKFLK